MSADSAPPTVRSARLSLALALADTGVGAPEAGDQLRCALTEPGSEPPEWRIRRALAELSRDEADGGTRFLTELVAAMRVAPPAERDEIAVAGLDLVGTPAADGALIALDAATAATLTGLARERAAPDVAHLAARVALARGEVTVADELLSTAPGLRERSGLADVVRVAQARQDLESLQPGLALAVLDEPRHGPVGSTETVLRALSLYVEHVDPAPVRDFVERHRPAADLTLVAVLADLRAAAATGPGAQRGELVDRALRAAGTVARNDDLRAEALLLRAQVLLEGALDLDEGRRMLARALRHLDHRPERLLWWRLQDQVRDDELHHYFLLECAAEQGRWEQILADAERMTIASTEYLQDAARQQRWGQAHEHLGSPREAAEHHRRAAADFTKARHRPQAIASLRQARSIASSPEIVLDLAELLWSASYPTLEGGDGEPTAIVEGLELIDAVDAELTPETAARACLLRAVLLCRRDDGLGRCARWAALPFALLAVLADPVPLWSAHLAWALDAAGLHRAASHFGREGVRPDETDQWLLETMVVTGLNWTGCLDGDTGDALGRLRATGALDVPQARGWLDAVMGLMRLHERDADGLRDVVEGPVFDALWARLVQTNALLMREGIEVARPALERVLDESVAAGEHETAAELAALVRPSVVREEIAKGREAARMSAHTAATATGIADLLEGWVDPGASEEVVDRITTLLGVRVRPYGLRNQRSALANLVVAHPELPGLADAVEAMVTVIDGRLEALDGLDAEIPFRAEIDSGEAEAIEPQVQQRVAMLLDVAWELARGCPGAAATRLAELGPDDEAPTACRLARSAAAQLVQRDGRRGREDAASSGAGG